MVSEKRNFYTVIHLTPNIIAGDQLYATLDPDGLLFAIVSLSMFITWQRMIGGRMKSDLRFPNTMVWNNSPLPKVPEELCAQVLAAEKRVIGAREMHPKQSLAQLYKPDSMPDDLIAVHEELDLVVDRAFGATIVLTSNHEGLKILFERYQEMTE